MNMSVNPARESVITIFENEGSKGDNLFIGKMTSLSTIKIFIVIASLYAILTQYSLICCEKDSRPFIFGNFLHFNLTHMDDSASWLENTTAS